MLVVGPRHITTVTNPATGNLEHAVKTSNHLLSCVTHAHAIGSISPQPTTTTGTFSTKAVVSTNYAWPERPPLGWASMASCRQVAGRPLFGGFNGRRRVQPGGPYLSRVCRLVRPCARYRSPYQQGGQRLVTECTGLDRSALLGCARAHRRHRGPRQCQSVFAVID